MENKDSEIESEEVVIEIEKDLHLPSRSKCCIYKVPKMLRRINEAAYTPQLVSIGPFHFHNEELKRMHKYKIKYFQDFCQRTEKTQKELFENIEQSEKRIKSCYEELPSVINKSNGAEANSNPSEECQEFLKLILIDAVFIIELFLKGTEQHMDDFILNGGFLCSMMDRDLMLLENQLPFFVLQELYDFAIPDQKCSFLRLACERFGNFIFPEDNDENPEGICKCKCFSNFLYCFWMSKCYASCQKCLKAKKDKDHDPYKNCRVMNYLIRKFEQENKPFQDNQVKHFTDLIRKFRSHNHPETNDKCITRLYTATRLHNAGVKFKVAKEEWTLNVKYKNGELIMPIILFDDNTEIVVRNLMAFEQFQYPDNTYICNYFLLLDFLINTKDDVNLLSENGVVANMLGDDKKVATMINSLCEEISYTRSGYFGVSKLLNQHCNNGWYKTIAIMRSVYFGHIWRGTGTTVAILLLLFTAIQTVDSIKNIFWNGNW